MVGVGQVFGCVGLAPNGAVPWGTPVPEQSPGVYVVTAHLGEEALGNALAMQRLGLPRDYPWGVGENIVYIGRTRQPLRRRVDQFYRHKYGRPSPHRGGQEVLTLGSVLRWVHWAATDMPVAAEGGMIEEYFRLTDRLPFANRVRGWRQTREQV